MRKIFILFVVVSLCGCVSNSKYEELKASYITLENTNRNLQTEIDELKNGEARIIELIKNSYHNKKYIKTADYLETLKKKHPESSYIRSVNKELPNLSNLIQQEKENIERMRQDSIRLANINNLGIWKVGYYVDDFEEPTDEGYISTDIYGKFSNSATTNSELKVRFIIDSNSIRINLYEYARNHPVKGEGSIYFIALDKNGNRHTFKAYNSDAGDTTVENLGDSSYEKVKKLLLSGGTIKFRATADRYGSPSEYMFTIENADFLENAFLKMELQAK